MSESNAREVSRMRDRPVDPSALVDADTSDDFDAEAVIERWEEIADRGHPIAPESSGGGL